jgi:hypothetical protein
MEPTYKCTQDELYEGCELLAKSLEEEILKTAAFKAKYNAVFVTDFKNTINNAKNIPDDDQRAAQQEVQRIQMVKQVDDQVRDALGSLRLYIRDAYNEEEVRKVRLREAGFDDYEAAMKYNWEKLKGLLKNANDFITNHTAELTASNNMPPAFATTVSNLKTNIDQAVTKLLNLRENSKQGTQAKIEANNELNKQRAAICEDGQHVFRTNEAKREQFVWESILQLFSPPGPPGLGFDVKEQGTNQPPQGAVDAFQKTGSTIINITTDSEGKAYIQSIEPGNYTGTITLTGYQTLSVQFELSTGVTSFKHWLLTPNP